VLAILLRGLLVFCIALAEVAVGVVEEQHRRLLIRSITTVTLPALHEETRCNGAPPNSPGAGGHISLSSDAPQYEPKKKF
jgi:hypothetical protein